MKKSKIILISILGATVLCALFVFSTFLITVDDCASPCRHDEAKVDENGMPLNCIAKCDRISLFDVIFGDD